MTRRRTPTAGQLWLRWSRNPTGERELAWVERYLREVCPELALARDDGVLFLSSLGEALNADWQSGDLPTPIMEAV